MKKSCLCCQSEDVTLKYKDVKDYEYHTYHPVNYLKCNRCGLLTQDPLPPSKQIPGFYNAQYRNHLTFGKPGLYRSLKYFKLWLLAAHISGFIDNKKDKKILEIGCGGGMLLFMLKKRGFIHLFGNDLSDSSQKDLSLYKISFKKGNAEEQFPFEGRFDLIILNHVFEHLLDPKSILAACCDHLNDKGKVIIIVPNADSLPSQVFGKFWDGINAPRHTYVFSKNSIESLKKNLGFHSLQIYPTADPMSWGISVQNILENIPFFHTQLRNGLAWYTFFIGILLTPISFLSVLGGKSANMICVLEK